MMSLWDALRMNMMISYQELVRTFPKLKKAEILFTLFSSLLAVNPQLWRGLALSFVKNPN